MKSIEELLAELGVASETWPVWAELETHGDAMLDAVGRAASDADFRRELWNRFGSRCAGVPVFGGDNANRKGPVLDERWFGSGVQGQSLSWLQNHPKRREEPVKSLLARALASLSPDLELAEWRESNDPFSHFLLACSERDLSKIAAFFQSGEGDSEHASIGLSLILGDLTLSEDPGLPDDAREVLEFLITHGGDVDETVNPNIGSTALQWAALKSDIETLDWLLEHGADINSPDFDGRTALLFAFEGNGRTDALTQNEQRKTIRFLVERGADSAFQRREFIKAPSGGELFEVIGPTLSEFVSPELRAFAQELGIELSAPDEKETTP